MAYRITVKQSAKDDAQDAYNYYEDKRPGLGEDFLEELKGCFNDIEKAPYNYGYIDDQAILRDVKVDRFPYVVIYEIEADEVIVYSVHDTRRHPKRRLRK